MGWHKELLLELLDTPANSPRRREIRELLWPVKAEPFQPYTPDCDIETRFQKHIAPFLECYGPLDMPHTFVCPFERDCNLEPRVKIVRGSISKKYLELEGYNLEGRKILFAANETDGRGTKKGNIVRLRAYWADLDNKLARQKFDIGSITPNPTAVVRTANGAHLHWLLDKFIECNDETMIDHEHNLRRIQAGLALFGADPNVCNVNACLRMPGYYHHKGAPTLVRLEAVNVG
jgi:hypothetical protein